MWCIFITILSGVLILEATETLSITSHGKVVICNVAERSINPEYSLTKHDLSLCTHLIYFEMDHYNAEKEGSTKFSNDYFNTTSDGLIFKQLPTIRKKYPNLKICLGVNSMPIDFSQMATDERKRKQFYRNAYTYLMTSEFMGLDLSWNYAQENIYLTEYTLFVKGLGDYLRFTGALLLIRVSEQTMNMDVMYIPILSNNFDFVHFTPEYPIDDRCKAYNLSDALREHGIKRIENIVGDLLDMGVFPSKIVIGFNIGGVNFDLAFKTRNYLGYNKLCDVISNEANGWIQFYDSEASMALAKKKHHFIDFWRNIVVFQNTHSIINRIRLALKYNIDGVMLTFINTDDVQGKCQIDDKVYNDFVSPHVNITLTMSVENSRLPLLNKINIMMTMAMYEIRKETKSEDAVIFLD
ncbi:probable chitinase 2 [Contarinia nasturtii]|uniref:probable chitinase 2 n=1 Tax=Contarinia nasturtii TaxID=265458 RepID=UPI0012D38B67|nr:probable chitinase 2 [Contarinia nasturtii]